MTARIYELTRIGACAFVIDARQQVLPSAQLKVIVALGKQLSHQPVHSGEIIYMHTERNFHGSYILSTTAVVVRIECRKR